jgi:hypothetical protein
VRRLLLIGCALIVAAPAVRAQQIRSVPLRRFGVIADAVGTANFAVADVTGDGIADIISCSNGAPFAVSYAGGSSFRTSWQGPAAGCTAVAVGNRDGDRAPEVVVVTGSPNGSGAGSLKIFDPRSLGGPIASVVLPGNVGGSDVAIADVDADGLPEIVVLTSAATYVYDARTLALQWTASGNGGTKLAIGDVDGDGHLDIVVNGSTGYVLDAYTQTLKWGYLGGFGRCMAVGDVDNDGKAEIVFVNGYSANVTILNGDTFTTTTVTGTSGYAIDSLAIGDANNDGEKEIVSGNNQWGNIEGHDAANGAKLWSITNSEHGTQAVIVGDVDGDGKRDVIWGAGLTSSGQDVLFIGDANAQTVKWASTDLDGPFVSVVGDIDGDGRQELVIASGSSASGYNGSIIEVFDLATGVSKGKLPVPNYDFRVTRLAIGQVDADGAREVIALGNNTYYTPQLLTWDGVTHAIEFASSVPPCCSSPTFVTSTLVVANIDGDAVDEIILAESDSKILVLNGASNVIQTSINTNGAVRDLSLADLDGNGVPDLVVGTSNGVYVYDTATWSLHGSVAINGGLQRVTANASGAVAVAFNNGTQQLLTFTGINLTPAWTCSLGSATSIGSLEIATLGGAQRLLAGNSNGTLDVFPLGGGVCPAFASLTVSSFSITNMKAIEATGDSRPDLLIDSTLASEIDLIGMSADMRGDVTGDGLINTADIDAITGYVFGATAGINPSADANADQRISVQDVVQLINYYYANGAAPPP